MSVHATRASARGVNQFIREALMIALAMVVLDVLGDRHNEYRVSARYS